MRPHAARSILALVSIVTIVGCGSDATANPLAPTPLPRSARSSDASIAQTIRIRGTLESHETDSYDQATNSLIVHLEGTGTASLIGRFTIVDDGSANLSTGLGEGRVTFTAANGDTFTAAETGIATIDGGFADVIDQATITVGTGRFTGASGTLVIVKRVDISSGLSSGWFEGTITFAK